MSELPDRLDIQNYFNYIFKNYEIVTDNPSAKIYGYIIKK